MTVVSGYLGDVAPFTEVYFWLAQQSANTANLVCGASSPTVKIFVVDRCGSNTLVRC
jgi:hypothetical protein